MNKEVEVIIIIIIRLFQKVDQWMNKDEQMDSEARKKLDDANQVDDDDEDDDDDDDDENTSGLVVRWKQVALHKREGE